MIVVLLDNRSAGSRLTGDYLKTSSASTMAMAKVSFKVLQRGQSWLTASAESWLRVHAANYLATGQTLNFAAADWTGIQPSFSAVKLDEGEFSVVPLAESHQVVWRKAERRDIPIANDVARWIQAQSLSQVVRSSLNPDSRSIPR